MLTQERSTTGSHRIWVRVEEFQRSISKGPGLLPIDLSIPYCIKNNMTRIYMVLSTIGNRRLHQRWCTQQTSKTQSLACFTGQQSQCVVIGIALLRVVNVPLNYCLIYDSTTI
ncbi:hypothetical protein TSO5_28790 [Azospirillum sp. TSO5]|nr:hypothetical protein TSO5_28790 [Azospirillum sp. TSO5]